MHGLIEKMLGLTGKIAQMPLIQINVDCYLSAVKAIQKT